MLSLYFKIVLFMSRKFLLLEFSTNFIKQCFIAETIFLPLLNFLEKFPIDLLGLLFFTFWILMVMKVAVFCGFCGYYYSPRFIFFSVAFFNLFLVFVDFSILFIIVIYNIIASYKYTYCVIIFSHDEGTCLLAIVWLFIGIRFDVCKNVSCSSYIYA